MTVNQDKLLTLHNRIDPVAITARCPQVSFMRRIVAPRNRGSCSETHSTRPRSYNNVHGIDEAWRHVVTDS